MMVFPSMLLRAAEEAGMKVPALDKDENWDYEAFPHFTVFCNVQLCRPIRWGEHWENAKVIAAIPDSEIKVAGPTSAAGAWPRISSVIPSPSADSASRRLNEGLEEDKNGKGFVC